MKEYDVLERTAVLLKFALAYAWQQKAVVSPQLASKHLWRLWQDALDAADVGVSAACIMLYKADGPSLIYEYIREVHPTTPWSACEGCDTETPYDENGDCLVCGQRVLLPGEVLP